MLLLAAPGWTPPPLVARSSSALRVPELLLAEPADGLGYVVENHPWESRPNPQFDYPQDEATALAIKQVRAQNSRLQPLLSELRNRAFFSYYAVDLLASCSYMPTSEAPCDLDACEIDPAEDVPPAMVERDENEYEFELDSWARWDMPSDYTEYYSLAQTPHGYTEYDGSRIWRFIHQKICFQLSLDEPRNRWKRDFNRAIAGFHASVSAAIVRSIAETDEAKAMKEFKRRLRDEPGAITNLYFAYVLSLNAIGDMRERLDSCSFLGEGDAILPTMRTLTGAKVLRKPEVIAAAENIRAQTDAGLAWQARLRTRDLLRVMNCVQCSLCKLHGKVAALGVAATFHVLLGEGTREAQESELDVIQAGQGSRNLYSLHRVEIAALVTYTAKLADACALVEEFQMKEKAAKNEDKAQKASAKAKAPPTSKSKTAKDKAPRAKKAGPTDL